MKFRVAAHCSAERNSSATLPRPALIFQLNQPLVKFSLFRAASSASRPFRWPIFNYIVEIGERRAKAMKTRTVLEIILSAPKH